MTDFVVAENKPAVGGQKGAGAGHGTAFRPIHVEPHRGAVESAGKMHPFPHRQRIPAGEVMTPVGLRHLEARLAME